MAALNKILHVEDEDDIRQITKLVLESIGGFEVESCSSGHAALEKVQDFAPDLIILDVMMPEMDGPMTLEALRNLSTAAAIPVIFMTAQAQPHERERLMNLGAIGIITKPYDPQALPEQLQTTWARHCNAV
jgi:CheY-like chemotaxis protein